MTTQGVKYVNYITTSSYIYILHFGQVLVNGDGTFSTSISAGGSLMKIEGTYTIIIEYGDYPYNVGETTFEFSGSVVTPHIEIEEP